MGQKIIEVNVVRIFVNDAGNFGSLAGIILDESAEIIPEERLIIARELKFSETIFINDLNRCKISLYSQNGEIPFASPILGAAWFIEKLLSIDIDSIICSDNIIPVAHIDGRIYIGLPSADILPPWDLKRLDRSEDVNELKAEGFPEDSHIFVWSMSEDDIRFKKIRARTFAPAWHIAEEEANGSGSVLLSLSLASSLEVHHGKGSVIRVINENNKLLVGGSVCLSDPIKLKR